MKVSESILKWLSENKDWFKDAAICKKVGINKGNFSKYKKEGYIPEKYLQPIMNIIMPLGFTLDEVIAENNKPEKKERSSDAKFVAETSKKNLATVLEPAEGTNRFFLKYGAFSHEEAKKLTNQ